jgi:hypothetical protein
MKPFVIDKNELINKIQENRDAHRGIYEEAMEGYFEAAVKFFKEQHDRALDGKPFQTAFYEPMPEDHTDDYDVVLDGLRWTQDQNIDLSISELRQYVRDEWGWKKEFTATSSNYLKS